MAVSAQAIRDALRRQVAEHGHLHVCQAHSLTRNALNGLLRGKGEIDPTAARKLGFERRTLYVPIPAQQDEPSEGGE